MIYPIKLFSGTSNYALAQDIAHYLGIELSEIEIKKFKDGEISVKILENVRSVDVFLIQSTSNPANDNIMELLLMVDAAMRASAQRITAVIPYYGYARQDRKVEPRWRPKVPFHNRGITFRARKSTVRHSRAGSGSG